jgi:hypothetical protein
MARVIRVVTQFGSALRARPLQTITPAPPFFKLAHRLPKMYAPSRASRKDNIWKSAGEHNEIKGESK